MGKTLDLSEINGGKVHMYHQSVNSDDAQEIFMSVTDFEGDSGASVIMEPRHARQLAQMLIEIADEAEHWED